MHLYRVLLWCFAFASTASALGDSDGWRSPPGCSRDLIRHESDDPNLVQNGDFDVDLQGWQTVGLAFGTWSPEDAAGAGGSGSVVITGRGGGLWQCLPVVAGTRYFVQVARKGMEPSTTSVGGAFTSGEGCTGPIIDVQLPRDCCLPAPYYHFNPPPTGDWQRVTGELVAPPNALSVTINIQNSSSAGLAYDYVHFSPQPHPPIPCSLQCAALAPRTISPGEEATFEIVTTGCSVTKPFIYRWDFGDGSESDSSDSRTTHRYEQTGAFVWRWSVTGHGSSCSGAGAITIANSQHIRRRAVRH